MEWWLKNLAAEPNQAPSWEIEGRCEPGVREERMAVIPGTDGIWVRYLIEWVRSNDPEADPVAVSFLEFS